MKNLKERLLVAAALAAPVLFLVIETAGRNHP